MGVSWVGQQVPLAVTMDEIGTCLTVNMDESNECWHGFGFLASAL